MKATQTDSPFLQAFQGENKQIPVWFMRQAGRYLPQYQKLKEKYSLNEMFGNPEIIADVTVMPIDTLNVDAAILFADILTLPAAMGLKITYEDKKGPVIHEPIRTQHDAEKLHQFDGLDYLEKGISLTRKKLADRVPLIGFAGAPFTVASYLVEGGSSIHFKKFIRFAQKQEHAFHVLMEKLTDSTIRYLQFQKEAGIQAFQLFDTWGGIVRMEDYEKWILPYIQRIFEAVDLPSIYYIRHGHHVMPFVLLSGADFISPCHCVNLNDPRLLQAEIGVQGNFYNMLLYANYDQIDIELSKILNLACRHKKYIFNLSHGVFPDIEVDKLKFIVDKVHQFPWGDNG